MALSELLEKAGNGDFLRSVAQAVLQLLMEADVEGVIGAGRYERSGERSTWRNGHGNRDKPHTVYMWPQHGCEPSQRGPAVHDTSRRFSA